MNSHPGRAPTNRARFRVQHLTALVALCGAALVAAVALVPSTAHALDVSVVRTSLAPIIGQAAAAIVSAVLVPGSLSAILYAVANFANRRLGKPSDERSFVGFLDRLLDRIVVTTRQGSINKWSVPVLGTSLFRDVVDTIAEADHEQRETVAPEPPRDRPSSSGFADIRALIAVAAIVPFLAIVGAAALSACKLPDPDGCVPYATRCSPLGVPQVCSASQRWQQAMSEPCPAGSVCREVVLPPSGRAAHVCAEPESSEVDGGAVDAAAP